MKKGKTTYYAYFLSSKQEVGIVLSWARCQEIMKGYSHQVKKFSSYKQALEWLQEFEPSMDPFFNDLLSDSSEDKVPSLYFDSGTGRKKGVEISVVNHEGLSIIDQQIPVQFLTEHNTYLISERLTPTNNYGELLGCYIALKIALKKTEYKRIYGDSRLVLEYWSKGFANKDKLNPYTVNLIQKVVLLRKKFESEGGVFLLIEGGKNPADLGFHRD